jgi:transposase
MAYECSEGVPGRRRHWPEAEKRRIAGEVGLDGQSLSDVARRYGIHASVIGRWCERFGEASTAVPFVPVTVAVPEAPLPPAAPPVVAPARDAVVEVFLANGRRLVVAESIAPSRLRLLIAAVEAE